MESSLSLIFAWTPSTPAPVPAPAAILSHSLRLPFNAKKKRNGWFFRAKLNDGKDPLLKSAMDSALIRFYETNCPEPLFLDPYAGCLTEVSSDTLVDSKKELRHYCIATKFIDDKLLRAVNHMDGLKQVVLLSDGMDTRPYRLNWPSSTIIFDISPERVFQKAAEELKGVGAKVPRNCLYLHVPVESSNVEDGLRKLGFNGNRPSIWAIQGLPVMTLASFQKILFLVSSMAMERSLFLGELPAWLAKTEFSVKSTQDWWDKLFMSNGFKVNMVGYSEIAKSLGKKAVSEDYRNILFVAEHLRHSDDQIPYQLQEVMDAVKVLEYDYIMETWRRELQRVEENGDEEGFEEL